MRYRLASRGPNAGKSFWGCSRFPQCRGTRDEDGTPTAAVPRKHQATLRPSTIGGSGIANGATTTKLASVGKRQTISVHGARGKSLARGDILDSRSNSYGPGKLVDRLGDDLVLEYFDSPGEAAHERRREVVPRLGLQRFIFTPETRVFWLDINERWRSGRVIETNTHRDIYVRGHEWEGFVPEAKIFVRWYRPLTDPVGFGGAGLLESPLLADMRRPFLQDILRQRSAAHGMAAALSSCIDLYEHQVETAWRVLQDPVQRYLLADEVGLGKTIEAGIVIRQLLLDDPELTVQLILPPFLIEQWKRELGRKFRIRDFVHATIRFGRDDEPETWAPADLVVVDEAHNLARLASSEQQSLRERHVRLAAIARSSPRLLMLSATPALHNERAFLAMLKLLDPAVHRATTIEDLRERLASRAWLGRLLLGLQPALPGFLLKNRLSELASAFPDDADLGELLNTARAAVDEDRRDDLAPVISALRTHIADVYRVHRRMIRTRRTAALEGAYPVTGRARPVDITLTSSLFADVTRLLDEWRQQVVATHESDPEALREAGRALATAVSLSLDPDSLRVWARERRATTDDERAILDRIDSDLAFSGRRDAITHPLADQLTYMFGAEERVVIFCASSTAASEVAEELGEYLGPSAVFRHVATDPPAEADRAIRAFEKRRSHAVLVADGSAEEGRNLQFADLVVHLGVPPEANRLEQRIGRCDRWGERADGSKWRSAVVVEDGDNESFAAAWRRILRDGFGVFDDSMASMQHAVDNATDETWTMLLTGGVDAADDAITMVRETLDAEVDRIREQDALDSIETTAGERSVFARISAVEARSAAFADTADALLSEGREAGNLRFARLGNPVDGVGAYELIKRLPGRQAQIPLMSAARLRRDFMPLQGHRGTFVRDVAVAGENLHLYRYGDEFIDAVSDYLWNDDRGRAYGMWRWIPTWPRAEKPVYRFDYAVEADPLPFLDSEEAPLAAFSHREGLDRLAIRRRADGMFPPLIVTLWLDVDLTEVADQRHLDALRAPYRKPSGGVPGGDYALNRNRIEYAYELIPNDAWSDHWRKVEALAQGLARGSAVVREGASKALAAAEADASTRLRQLRLRASRTSGAERTVLQQETAREAAVGEAMAAAIAAPNLRLDSTGIVIVSGRGLGQDEAD
jgi:ATP-dependent helicase HepA